MKTVNPDLDRAWRDYQNALTLKRLQDALLTPAEVLARGVPEPERSCSVCTPTEPCWFHKPWVPRP